MKMISWLTFFALLISNSLYGKSLLISVGDLQKNDSEWLRKTCEQIYIVANQVSPQGVTINCHRSNTESFVDPYISEQRNKNDYFLNVLRTREGHIDLEARNWSAQGEEDFKSLGWIFKDAEKSQVSKEQAMAHAIANFIFYIDNEQAFKIGLMMNAISESSAVSYDEKSGQFHETLTNEVIDSNRAYKLFSKESGRKINYLRTGIELGVLLSSGMAIYYKNLVYNAVDFDYGFRDGLKKKWITGEAILFDDNDKFANYGHAFAGVIYHQVARANGASAMESFLISLASSAVWETMEYHEVFSINDMIVTPVGGYIIGEAMYQTSCALISKGTLGAKALGYTLSPMLAGNHAMDRLSGNKDKTRAQPDCKKPRFSDISLKIGLERGQKAYEPSSNQEYFAALESTVINIPGYGKEGKAQGLVYDTAMSKFLLELNGNQGLTDLRIVAEVVAAAYYDRKITRDEKGQLRGYEMAVGIGSASTWNDRGGLDKDSEGPDTKEDFYGTINILGATAFADVYYKGTKIRAEFGFYGDFTMVKSYALDGKIAAEGLEGQPTVIQKRGYYWGAGSTALAGISAEHGRWKVGYEGQRSQATIIHGRGRFQDQVTQKDNFHDELAIDKFYVKFKLTKSLTFELAQEFITRKGQINKNYAKSGTEKRTRATLNYQF